jgi:ribonuclease Z
MKRIGITFLILLVALAIVGVIQQKRILTAVLQKGIESRISADLMSDLPDGLHLGLCGAGGPLPAPNASGACVVIIAGERLFVVDAGTDGLRNLSRMGLSAGRIEAVFLTHFHSDHIDGLGEMATIRWVANANTAPLPVYGPTGVQTVVDGFNMAYSMDTVYRHDHHGDSVAPLVGKGMLAKEFVTPTGNDLVSLLADADLNIEVLTVGHAPVVPAVGYRFTYKGRTLLISGDTIAVDSVREHAQGIDLLVHEALAPNLVNMMHKAALNSGNAVLAKVTADILDYHASPVAAAQIAKDAGVGHLLYYHIVPPLVLPGQESLFLDGAEKIFPAYTVGQDGVFFSLPADSDEIIKLKNGL